MTDVKPKPQDKEAQAAAKREALRLCRINSPLAVRTVLCIMADDAAKGFDRLKAAEMILDRAMGKPAQMTVNIEPDDESKEVKTMAASVARDILQELSSAP